MCLDRGPTGGVRLRDAVHDRGEAGRGECCTGKVEAPPARLLRVGRDELERGDEQEGGDHPVYWVGPKHGFSYELTSGSGRVWVRYLPAGVTAGDPRASFLVIGTYEQPHAYANLKRATKRPGSVTRAIANHGLLVYNAQRGTSVYFSYPGAGYQVEVFARSAETARSLVLAGETAPIK